MKRIYIDVIALFPAEGSIKPLKLVWNEKEIAIDKVLDVQVLGSKTGAGGYRFKCKIEGKERYLWLEGMGDFLTARWFVEV